MSGAEEVVVPESPAAVAEVLATAAGSGERVLVLGRDTRGRPGALPPRVDRVLSTRGLDAVVEHQPEDLTLTAGAGLGLDALDDLLAAHGQWLPCQAYRRRGTLGGLLASAADGVLDAGHGRPRDLIIGARVAHADGSLAASRGRVVKNVAGYDVPRLMVGSQGTLGALVEVSLRLLPRPEASATLQAEAPDEATALTAAVELLRRPWDLSFVDLLCGGPRTRLVLGLDGLAERVAGQVTRLAERLTRDGLRSVTQLAPARGRELRRLLDEPLAAPRADLDTGADPARHPAWVLRWTGRLAALGELPVVLREHVPGARAVLRPALGLALIAGPPKPLPPPPATGGARTPDDSSDETPVDTGAASGEAHPSVAEVPPPGLLSELRRRGHAVLLAGPPAARREPDAVWGPPPPDLVLMRDVKTALDPAGVLCPGRFVGGL